MSFGQSETDRMLAGILLPGTIEAVDYGAARVRVRSGDWVSAWLPWAAHAAGQVRHWCPPSVGEQALILSPSGQPEQGMVLAGFYANANQNDKRGDVTATDWPDGARECYDHKAHEYSLTLPDGRITLTVGGATLEMKEDGATLTVGGTKLEIKEDGAALTTPTFTVNAPESNFTGAVVIGLTLLVNGLLSFLGGLLGLPGGGASGAKIEGDIRVTGNVNVVGDVQAGAISLQRHTHTEQGDGADVSPPHP